MILLDDNSDVTDFVKVKAWWYVLLRALREKVRTIRGASHLPDVYRLIKRRFGEIKRDMEVDDIFINSFLPLGISFAEWIFVNHLSKDKQMNQIIDNYPPLWNEFLLSKNLPLDDSLLTCSELIADSSSVHSLHFSNNDNLSANSPPPLPLLLLPQGIPGLGKSFLAQRICQKLNDLSIKSVQIAQDDFDKHKNSGQACFNHVKEILPHHDVVIVARNNANIKQYAKYLSLSNEFLCRIGYMYPAELLKTDPHRREAIYMSIASVLCRKYRNEAHPTNTMSDCDLASLPLKFLGEFNPNLSGFPFRVTRDVPVDIPPMFDEIIKRFEARGFSAEGLSHDELQSLKLTNKEFVESLMNLHRSVEEIAEECCEKIIHLMSNYFLPSSFYCCFFSKDLCDKIYAAVVDVVGVMANSWQIHCNHVTLIHANDYWTSTQHWEKVSKYEGKKVIITPLGVLLTEKACVVSVDIALENGEKINDLVLSNRPHITIATAPGVKAFQSAQFLEENADKIKPLNFVSFSGSIILSTPDN